MHWGRTNCHLLTLILINLCIPFRVVLLFGRLAVFRHVLFLKVRVIVFLIFVALIIICK